MVSRSFSSFTVAATLALTVVGDSACAGTARCAETAACPLGAACELDGTCQPLAVDPVARFSRAVTLTPHDIVTTGVQPDDDTVRLGGAHSAGVLLSFDDLPEETVVAAELVLEPHAEWNGATEEAHAIVSRVRPFDSSHRSVETIRDRVGEQLVPAGVARPLRFDITSSLRDAQAAGVRHLDLAIRIESPRGHALRYSLRPRPRLELLVP